MQNNTHFLVKKLIYKKLQYNIYFFTEKVLLSYRMNSLFKYKSKQNRYIFRIKKT